MCSARILIVVYIVWIWKDFYQTKVKTTHFVAGGPSDSTPHHFRPCCLHRRRRHHCKIPYEKRKSVGWLYTNSILIACTQPFSWCSFVICSNGTKYCSSNNESTTDIPMDNNFGTCAQPCSPSAPSLFQFRWKWCKLLLLGPKQPERNSVWKIHSEFYWTTTTITTIERRIRFLVFIEFHLKYQKIWNINHYNYRLEAKV